MNWLAKTALAAGALMALSTAMPALALAGKAPTCLQSEKEGRSVPEAQMQAWWDRRTPEEQKYIGQLPCDDRYIPMTCIFLFDPDIKGCTNKGVADRRANAACQAKGYDLMSQEMADCKEAYKKNFKPPFP